MVGNVVAWIVGAVFVIGDGDDESFVGIDGKAARQLVQRNSGYLSAMGKVCVVGDGVSLLRQAQQIFVTSVTSFAGGNADEFSTQFQVVLRGPFSVQDKLWPGRGWGGERESRDQEKGEHSEHGSCYIGGDQVPKQIPSPRVLHSKTNE